MASKSVDSTSIQEAADLADRIAGGAGSTLMPFDLASAAKTSNIRLVHSLDSKRNQTNNQLVVRMGMSKNEARVALAKKLAKRAIAKAYQKGLVPQKQLDDPKLINAVAIHYLLPHDAFRDRKFYEQSDEEISSRYFLPSSFVRSVRAVLENG